MASRADKSPGPFGRMMDSLGVSIMAGEFLPGTLLDPNELETSFGVSRSVVREVLRSLSTRGLVRATSGQGTFVAARSQWSLLDPTVLRWRYEGRHDQEFLTQLTELRLTIEPTAARFAAERRNDVDVAELSIALDAMAEASTTADHVEADLAFHRALLSSTHNELFENMFAVIETGLRARDAFVHSSDNFEASSDLGAIVDSHRAVLDAVRAKRPRAAELSMRQLLDRSAADIESVAVEGHSSARAAG